MVSVVKKAILQPSGFGKIEHALLKRTCFNQVKTRFHHHARRCASKIKFQSQQEYMMPPSNLKKIEHLGKTRSTSLALHYSETLQRFIFLQTRPARVRSQPLAIPPYLVPSRSTRLPDGGTTQIPTQNTQRDNIPLCC